MANIDLPVKEYAMFTETQEAVTVAVQDTVAIRAVPSKVMAEYMLWLLQQEFPALDLDMATVTVEPVGRAEHRGKLLEVWEAKGMAVRRVEDVYFE